LEQGTPANQAADESGKIVAIGRSTRQTQTASHAIASASSRLMH